MMDGRVAAIRDALDDAGFEDTALMSYAVKFASAYYGPFREAADSTPSSGDRQSYQMDFRNPREAVREALLDADEGADWLMVKPALPYLDVIRAVREAKPVAAVGLQRVRRVLGREGRGREWLARRGAHRAREPARDSPRRRGPDHHVSRARRLEGKVAVTISKGSKGAANSKRQQSDAWFERAKKVTPGGVNSPVRAFGSVGGTPLVIRSAMGAVIDGFGRPRVSRFRRLVGPADLGPRAPEDRRGRRSRMPARHVVRRAVPAGDRAGRGSRRARIPASSKCASCRRAPRPSPRRGAARARRDRAAISVVKFSGCYHGHVDYLLVAAGSGLVTFGQPVVAGRAERARGVDARAAARRRRPPRRSCSRPRATASRPSSSSPCQRTTACCCNGRNS